MRIGTFAVAVVALAAAIPANAVTIAVANASFETLPSGGLPFGCGTACSFSVDAIPGWVNSGNSGQFQPGTLSGNTAFFTTLPFGPTIAYTNDGTITQTVGATAVAGRLYTLAVGFGVRNDIGNPGSIRLIVGSNSVLATGTAPSAGNWSIYTASYLATVADAGGAITIELASPAGQGDFDGVSLTANVPEPASWALLIAGFGLTGAALRRRRAAAIAA